MSLLTDVRESVPIASDDDAFDKDLLRYINSTLTVAKQLGVPLKANRVSMDSEWSDVVDLDTYPMFEDYLCSKVRLKFDPPLATSALEALQKNIAELEWRLNAEAENMG